MTTQDPQSTGDEFNIIPLFEFHFTQKDNDYIKSLLCNDKLYFKKEYGSPQNGCAKCMYRKIFQDIFNQHKSEILKNPVLCNLTGTDGKFFLPKSQAFEGDSYEYNIDDEYQMCKKIDTQKLLENLKISIEELHLDKSGCKICVRKQPHAPSN